MRNLLLSTLAIFFCFCSKKADIKPQYNYTEAIQLKKGNYWVYESKTIYLGSGEFELNPDDSTFIKKDTFIGNQLFYKLENLYGLEQYRRHAGSNIINEDNNIFFSATNFADTLYKNPPFLGFMKQVEEEITVPAGTFETVMFIVIEKDNHHHHDPNDPASYDHNHSIASKVWYAKNIGIVKSVFYYSNSLGYELSLKRYKVQ